MKVLWITNTVFPDVCKELNIPVPVIGGWMFSAAKGLLSSNANIKLSVATIYKGNDVKEMILNGITYYLLPVGDSEYKYNYTLESHWKSIDNKFSPDVVHIHGTELPHGLAYIRSCGKKNVIVSIQGLLSVYQNYYFGGIDKQVIRSTVTLRDLIRHDSLFDQRKKMIRRSYHELEYIKSVDHIIGRTEWDKSHAWALNKDATYHFCNETLRSSFYEKRWFFNKCDKNSLFLSQAHYPIKGLHIVLMALPIILKEFPSVKLYVAGDDFSKNVWYRLSGYGKLIRSLVSDLKLEDKIIFTGQLSEEQMSDRFLKSNIFICPSCIENSSNSIGEAQLLGVPCVASYVGGVSDLIIDGITGLLYRFEEKEMLAKKVCNLLSNTELQKQIASAGKEVADIRHNKINNAVSLHNIYKKVCNIL